MPGITEVEKEVRKLRKKLRQIENLERLEFEGRELNEEEEEKVIRKPELRKILKAYLLRYEDELALNLTSSTHDLTSSTIDSSFHSPSPPENMNTKHTIDPINDLLTDDEDHTVSPPSTSQTDLQNEDYDAMDEMELEGDEEQNNIQEEDEWQTVGGKKESPKKEKQVPSPKKSEVSKKEKDPPKRKLDERPKDQVKASASNEPEIKQRKEEKHVRTKEPKEPSAHERMKQEWLSRDMTVFLLEGHNDLITSIYLDTDWLVSGSRDTMVKVWDARNGLEEKSFGSHTDTVTAVLMLPTIASRNWSEHFELDDTDRIVISGSCDCTIKVWSLNTGALCESIYTYNPVTSLAFLDVPGLVISGTGGGKVELWDMKTKANLQSLLSHDGPVNHVKTQASMAYSCGVDGIINVYQLRDSSLHLLHSSESVTCPSSPLLLRPVRSLAVSSDNVYYGDDGTNLKVLEWKKGKVHKLRNHSGEFGSTDGMSSHDDVILASGYDLDEGVGYINVFGLPFERYICTLTDESFGRFMTISTASDINGRLMLATGGLELRLWVPTTNRSSDDFMIRGEYLPEFSKKVKDSDEESDEEVSEAETTSFFWSRKTKVKEEGEGEDEESGRWGSWCSVL